MLKLQTTVVVTTLKFTIVLSLLVTTVIAGTSVIENMFGLQG